MPSSPRPPRAFATGLVTRVLRIAALLAVALSAVSLLVGYPSMPELVPTHFDAGGRPDAWGSKVSVLWLAGVMVAVATLVGVLSTQPRRCSYPVPVTEENAQRLYREGERTLVWLLVALAAVFAGLAQLVVGGAGGAVLGLGLVGVLGATATGAVRMLGATGSR
ncbi:hypothetical protein ACVWW9_001614 [Agrococcus sp. UYP33]